MRVLALALAFAAFARPAAADLAPAADVDGFLRPYLEELEKATQAEQLEQLRQMPQEDAFVLLHDTYVEWMAEVWLPAKRHRRLIRYLEANGAPYPSQQLLKALWRKLDRELPPERRAAIEAKRKLIARRSALYGTLRAECSQQITAHKEELERCYSTSDKPIVSFRFGVAKSGRTTGEVLGAPPNVRECLQTVVSTFTFSPFDTEEALHLWITEFPRCRVREISRLYP